MLSHLAAFLLGVGLTVYAAVQFNLFYTGTIEAYKQRVSKQAKEIDRLHRCSREAIKAKLAVAQAEELASKYEKQAEEAGKNYMSLLMRYDGLLSYWHRDNRQVKALQEAPVKEQAHNKALLKVLEDRA